jgi:hypothetical protein
MSKFKVGDKVVTLTNGNWPEYGAEAGMVGIIVTAEPNLKCFRVRFPDNPGVLNIHGQATLWEEKELDFYKEPNMKDEDVVRITVGAVKKAAGQCSTARDVLKTLCPEVFKEREFQVGDIVARINDWPAENIYSGDMGIVMGPNPYADKDVRVQYFKGGAVTSHSKCNLRLVLRPSLKCAAL